MKKLLLIFAAVACFATAAQAQAFGLGDKNITATVGFGGNVGIPVALSYEQCVYSFGPSASIGVGGYAAYSNYKDSFATATYNYSNMYLAAEGNFHYTSFEKFDFYAGLRLGYKIISGSWDDDYIDLNYSLSTSDIHYSGHVGINYYLSDSWAFNTEFSAGMSILAIGATYRF
ncbi:MAG: hypothetical protein SNG49_02835 [Rikenellaceae bacterium]